MAHITLCFWCGKRNRKGVCDICWSDFKRWMMLGSH